MIFSRVIDAPEGADRLSCCDYALWINEPFDQIIQSLNSLIQSGTEVDSLEVAVTITDLFAALFSVFWGVPGSHEWLVSQQNLAFFNHYE